MNWLRIPSTGAAVMLLLALGSFSQQTQNAPKTAPPNVPDFELRGISFTECACTAYACPCRSNGHPTHGGCDAADFVNIRQGHYGKVKMDGFKAVVIGDLIDKDPSKVHGVVYFDDKTTPDQREAFKQMVGFMFAWNPPKLEAEKVVPIDFQISSDRKTYTLKVPGILEEKGVMKADAKPQPAMDLWGNQITYVDNVVFKYSDPEHGNWDLSGRQANVKEFHTTKAMWDQKKMLIQHGDMSGTWTAEQRKLIQELGMKAD